MTNQRSWVLLVLRLGIAIFPQIAAKSDHDVVAEKFPDIIDEISEPNVENCINEFEKKMKIATSNWQGNNPIEASKFMGEMTQEFLSCILPGEIEPEAIEPVDDSVKDQLVSEIKNQNNQSKFRYIPSHISTQVFQQMQDFHLRPDYKRVTDQLQVTLHRKIREFVDSDLYKDDHQTNYGILIKEMLYEMCETMLRRNLMTKVEVMIDRRMNPYIKNKFQVRQRFNGEFFRSSIQHLINGLETITATSEPYDIPNCVFEKVESTIECVFSYVAALVMLESIVDNDHTALKYWTPLGVKLSDNIELLLIQIVAKHEEDFGLRLLEPIERNYLSDIYRIRALIKSCIGLMRKKHDEISRGDSSSIKSLKKAINKCQRSCLHNATELEQDIMSHAEVGDLDPALMPTLQRRSIRKVMKNQMDYYPKLTDLIPFVRQQIDDDVLDSNEDPEKSWAWEMVAKWNESSIVDPIDRLALLFGKGAFANLTCPVIESKEISAEETATDVCWRPIFEDLLIIESAVLEDGVSLEIVFYGHPILMNYIYIVDQELSGEKPDHMSNSDINLRR